MHILTGVAPNSIGNVEIVMRDALIGEKSARTHSQDERKNNNGTELVFNYCLPSFQTRICEWATY